MNWKLILSLIFYVLLCGHMVAQPSFDSMSENKSIVHWRVGKSSRLIICGSSNVNNFCCEMDYTSGSDTLRMNVADKNGTVYFEDQGLTIGVNNFDCNNLLITSDFKKTLKAKIYPDIVIRFLNLKFIKDLSNHTEQAVGDIEIFIAGTTNIYKIPYDILFSNKDLLQLKGNKKLKLDEFCLSAPSRLMGMVKVNNEIEVDFDLMLNRIDTPAP